MKGNLEAIWPMFEPSLEAMARHIADQKKRVGGNWAVAFACFSRDHREKLRNMLGPHLVFIVLKLSVECMRKRTADRHGPDANHYIEMFEKMHGLYEDVEDDEVNAYNIEVDEAMSEDDVVSKVLETLEKL